MLSVYYDRPIGAVKLPAGSDWNQGDFPITVPIYQCNGLFAAVFQKVQMIFFAVDKKHLKAMLGLEKGCSPDNLFKGLLFKFNLSDCPDTIRQDLVDGFKGCNGCKVIFEEGGIESEGSRN